MTSDNLTHEPPRRSVALEGNSKQSGSHAVTPISTLPLHELICKHSTDGFDIHCTISHPHNLSTYTAPFHTHTTYLFIVIIFFQLIFV